MLALLVAVARGVRDYLIVAVAGGVATAVPARKPAAEPRPAGAGMPE